MSRLSLPYVFLSIILFCTFLYFFFFFFNDTATTEIYTLSLHDALPICRAQADAITEVQAAISRLFSYAAWADKFEGDRKSTRLNSSHGYISYAVFCLKKKKIKK